jgi:hypothetical protein
MEPPPPETGNGIVAIALPDTCVTCKKYITDHIIEFGGETFHKHCFLCAGSCQVRGRPWVSRDERKQTSPPTQTPAHLLVWAIPGGRS